MEQNQQITLKKNHFNRFSYLLTTKQSQKVLKKDSKQPNFSLTSCIMNPCKDHEDIKINEKLFSQDYRRRPNKFQLKSPSHQMFQKSLTQDPLLSSFLAYTPSKSSQQSSFRLNSDMSSYSNQQTVLKNKVFFDTVDQKSSRIQESLANRFTSNPLQNPCTKSFFKKDQLSSIICETQKQTGNKNSDLNLSSGLDPSMTSALPFQSSVDYGLNKIPLQTQKNTKHCLAKPILMKTKEMSLKLRQSSTLNFQNSIKSTLSTEILETPKGNPKPKGKLGLTKNL